MVMKTLAACVAVLGAATAESNSCPTSSTLKWPTLDCQCFFGQLGGVESIIDATDEVPPTHMMVHYSSENGTACPIPKAPAVGFQKCSHYIKVSYTMCTLLAATKADSFVKPDEGVFDFTPGPMLGVRIGCEKNVTKVEHFYYGNQTFTKPPMAGGEEPRICAPASPEPEPEPEPQPEGNTTDLVSSTYRHTPSCLMLWMAVYTLAATYIS